MVPFGGKRFQAEQVDEKRRGEDPRTCRAAQLKDILGGDVANVMRKLETLKAGDRLAGIIKAEKVERVLV
jgi:hypothetical protein